MSDTRNIGRKQKAMLADMMRYGDGMFPLHWRLSHDKRKILESLRRRGLVTLVHHSSGQMVYRITSFHLPVELL